MTDFDLAIINSFKTEFEIESSKLCLFSVFFTSVKTFIVKFKQTIFKNNNRNENESSICDAAHSMCALAFVPAKDVVVTYDLARDGINRFRILVGRPHHVQ